jgi:deazaflavin-dependent oxidoreductase (nitroreductase family)
MDVREHNRRVIDQFRAGGDIEGMHRDRLLLLTTVGRRSGQRRTSPMMFHRDDQGLFVIASNVGAPRHPDWYLNLAADPHVTVEIGAETFDAIAVPLTGAALEGAWATITGLYPFFIEHADKAGRVIPVVELQPTRDA